MLTAVNLSDFSVVVARPTVLDVAAARETIALVQRASCPGMIVLNQCPPLRDGEEPALVRQAIERLHFSKLPVSGARLRSRAAYQHAFAHSRGVTEWDPASPAARDVLRLLAEISEELAIQRVGSPSQDPPAQWKAPPPLDLSMQQAGVGA